MSRRATVVELHPETNVVRASYTAPTNTPIATPIYQTSIFGFDDLDAFADAWSRPDGEFSYSRLGNPTVRALEDAIAALEGGAAAMATASGSAAVGVTLLSLLN